MTFSRLTGWMLVTAALSALVLPWEIALLGMGLIAVVAGVDAWQVRRVPPTKVDVAPILSRGVVSEFRLSPIGRWPRIRLRQPLVPDVVVSPQEADRVLVAEIVVNRRGTHHLPPALSRSTGPLGMGGWTHRTGSDRPITVYPDMPAARHLASAVRLGRFREEGKRTRGPLGLGTEFESIREYRPDDDIRQINWRATARLETPMSNQFRVEQDRDVICLVDCGRLMSAATGDRTRLDVAVDAVAAIAAVADQAGDRVGVVAFDDRVRRMVHPRRDGGRHVVHAIHDLEPSNRDSDYALAFGTVLSAKRAFVLIFTDIIDEAAARPLVNAIPALARKHSLAVASVVDPDLDLLMRSPADNLPQVLKAATAVRFVEAKERVAAILAHRGVVVVEAGLDSLSARCVAAYLRAKRTGRL